MLAALSELVENKNATVALKIFELGMKNFANVPDFVLTYLDFLYYTGNYPNMRAVIEVALKEIPPEEAAPVWDRFALCETNHGTLASVRRAFGEEGR